MSEPLNRNLYDALSEMYGTVRIANEGEAFAGRYCPNFTAMPGEPAEKLLVTATGEQYRICCPCCTDTRYRLYIGHRFGFRDERGNYNRWMLFCQNEDCMSDPQRRHRFADNLSSLPTMRGTIRLLPGRPAADNGPATLPGPHYLLDKLPLSHPAVSYLQSRFYATDVLGRYYKVGYCPSSMNYLARHRIVAPVLFAGKLRGWQARYIGELDWKDKEARHPPKWYTCPSMHKSQFVDNYDNAVKCRTGVVVEGKSTGWNLGPMHLATMGSSCSAIQARHLVSGFKNHSLVWLWDADVKRDEKKMHHLQKVLDQLQGQFRHGLAVVWLPDGMDTGSTDRGYIRSFIEQEARGQGVKVSWKLR